MARSAWRRLVYALTSVQLYAVTCLFPVSFDGTLVAYTNIDEASKSISG